MSNFNFEDTITLNNFDFGLSGEFTTFIFDEGDVVLGDYDFEFGEGTGTIFMLFTGTNNSFNSIWCDPKASLKNGKFYVARQEDLTIVNHNDSEALIEDFYSTSVQGASTDTLDSDDIVDINVNF